MRFLLVFLFLGVLADTAWAGVKIQYPVQCENKAECSPSVAGLGTSSSSVCTGFLIEKDILVTNFHCLPAEIQKADASCQDKIHFYFPATQDYVAEEADCDKVISLSNPLRAGSLGTDFAILRLARRIQRPTLDVNSAGIRDGEEMTIFKVDPVPGTGGILKKISCPAVQNTILNPYFNNNLSPVISLIPCKIIKGNSGSPMLDSSGYVKGVISAKSELPVPLSFEKQAASAKVDMAVGSNFSCIDIPSSSVSKTSLNPECRVKLDEESLSKLSEQMYDAARKKLETELNKSVPDILADLKKSTHNVLEWKPITPKASEEEQNKGVQYIFQFTPACVNLIKEKIKKEADHLRSTEVSYAFSRPVIQVVATYDDRYRIVAHLNKSQKSTTVSMSPRDLLNGDDFKVYMDEEAVSLPSCFVRRVIKPPL